MENILHIIWSSIILFYYEANKLAIWIENVVIRWALSYRRIYYIERGLCTKMASKAVAVKIDLCNKNYYIFSFDIYFMVKAILKQKQPY